MTRPNTARDRDTQDVAQGAARVGVFDRAVATPDRLASERERERMALRAMRKLSAEEGKVLVGAIHAEVREKLADREKRILHFIERVAAFCLVPAPCPVKVMGVVYALDLSAHKGMSMSSMARRMGVTRASLSNAAWTFTRANKLEPSRWMRSEEATKASRKARVRVCKGKTRRQ